MNGPKRIGILGGTYDPIHNAHLAIARAALASASLDRLLFVVAARPPHKTQGAVATPAQRLAMVEAALAEEPGMEASTIELEREGPSYTGETLSELHKIYRDAQLFLIIGLDSLADLPNWKDPHTILAHARLLVAPRPGGHYDVPDEFAGAYDLLDLEETDLSSTDIRERIASGECVGHLVPQAVERLIREEGIYHAPTTDRPGR